VPCQAFRTAAACLYRIDFDVAALDSDLERWQRRKPVVIWVTWLAVSAECKPWSRLTLRPADRCAYGRPFRICAPRRVTPARNCMSTTLIRIIPGFQEG
jgi:hypothetical protein